jgi:hypothetical protein
MRNATEETDLGYPVAAARVFSKRNALVRVIDVATKKWLSKREKSLNNSQKGFG